MITYNRISENVFQNHFGNVFQGNFGFCFPKYLTFWKIEFEILEYEWKKINLKIIFKSISENRIKKI
jgi:hypothetical protein